MKKVLYISYDGMTDPLGQSQVINYLIGLTEYGYQFDILSFEKADRYKRNGQNIQELLNKHSIGWHPQIFHTSPPILSKIYDRIKLLSVSKQLHKKNEYDLIHCRSYTAAEVGLSLKRNTGVKFLFDMRGFWADEKADGGGWDRANWFWNRVYLFYKKKEQQFIEEADYIISLTDAAKLEIEKWPFYNKNVPIDVIPCCADINHFSLTSAIKKTTAREKLGLAASTFVLSYLGSLGSWYMLAEMLDFFSCLLKENQDSKFLIITNSKVNEVIDSIKKHGLDTDKVIVINLPYQEVPDYMYASDLSLSFIKPVYSKMSSSPVKIGEILSMGIPMVMSDIGDANKIKLGGACLVVDDFTEAAYYKVIKTILNQKETNPEVIRNWSIEHFSLDAGVNSYQKVYEECL